MRAELDEAVEPAEAVEPVEAVEPAPDEVAEVEPLWALEVPARAVVAARAELAGWLARARPTVAPKTSALASTSPRRANWARRRMIAIGVAGIEDYGTTRG